MNRVPAVLVELINAGGTEDVEDGIYTMKNGRFKSMSWGRLAFHTVVF